MVDDNSEKDEISAEVAEYLQKTLGTESSLAKVGEALKDAQEKKKNLELVVGFS